MLYNGSDVIRDVEWVIFDEVHYISDSEVRLYISPCTGLSLHLFTCKNYSRVELLFICLYIAWCCVGRSAHHVA